MCPELITLILMLQIMISMCSCVEVFSSHLTRFCGHCGWHCDSFTLCSCGEHAIFTQLHHLWGSQYSVLCMATKLRAGRSGFWFTAGTREFSRDGLSIMAAALQSSKKFGDKLSIWITVFVRLQPLWASCPWTFLFLRPFRLALVPTKPPLQLLPGALSRGEVATAWS